MQTALGQGASIRVLAAREPRKISDGGGAGTGVITRTRVQTKKPSMYRVLLLNDDYTPMEFVVVVFYKRSSDKNQRRSLSTSCCTYTITAWENAVYSHTKIAETKVDAGDGPCAQKPTPACNA